MTETENYDRDDLFVDKEEYNQEEPERTSTSWFGFFISLATFLVGSVVIGYLLYQHLLTAPALRADEINLTIERGQTQKDIAEKAAELGLIRSKAAMLVYLRLNPERANLKAGNYTFTESVSLPEFIETLVAGNPLDNLVKFTHIEGEPASLLSRRAAETLPNLSEGKLYELTKPYEGKLFPDTYLIPKDYTEEQLLELLLKTFNEKTVELAQLQAPNNLTFEEVIILASIIEREANTDESMALVASVFHNRLSIGMALQADASIEYALDKPLQELTADDLKLDTPYNTYLYPGLPPTPISNPGLAALNAAIRPATSDYFFYITGDDGEFYFAKDFDEHRLNIGRYLR
jgi:UPF0755 protein